MLVSTSVRRGVKVYLHMFAKYLFCVRFLCRGLKAAWSAGHSGCPLEALTAAVVGIGLGWGVSRMPPPSRQGVCHPGVLLCMHVLAEDSFCHQEFLQEIGIVADGRSGLLTRGVWWLAVCVTFIILNQWKCWINNMSSVFLRSYFSLVASVMGQRDLMCLLLQCPKDLPSLQQGSRKKCITWNYWEDSG